MTSKLTIEELMEGSATTIRGDTYLSPSDYVSPFLDRLEVLSCTVQARMKEGMPPGVRAYDRVCVHATIPGGTDSYPHVMGLAYSLDGRIPLAKIYQGALYGEEGRLHVMKADYLSVQKILPDEGIDFGILDYFQSIGNDTGETAEEMREMEVEDGEKEVGRWIRNTMYEVYDTGFTHVKLATAVPVEAFRRLFVEQDRRFRGNRVSLFNAYDTFTWIATCEDSRDIANKAEKSILSSKILYPTNKRIRHDYRRMAG